MAIVTVGDVLDRAQDFELQLERYYAAIRDQSSDNGVRLLTYYLARHRRHQEAALAEQDPDVVHRVRTVELRFDIPLNPPRTLPFSQTPEAIRGETLLEMAIEHDSNLVAVYRAILDQPVGDDVQSLLEVLIRMEERDIVMMKKMQAMHYF